MDFELAGSSLMLTRSVQGQGRGEDDDLDSSGGLRWQRQQRWSVATTSAASMSCHRRHVPRFSPRPHVASNRLLSPKTTVTSAGCSLQTSSVAHYYKIANCCRFPNQHPEGGADDPRSLVLGVEPAPSRCAPDRKNQLNASARLPTDASSASTPLWPQNKSRINHKINPHHKTIKSQPRTMNIIQEPESTSQTMNSQPRTTRSLTPPLLMSLYARSVKGEADTATVAGSGATAASHRLRPRENPLPPPVIAAHGRVHRHP